jgi:hypothetical protein
MTHRYLIIICLGALLVACHEESTSNNNNVAGDASLSDGTVGPDGDAAACLAEGAGCSVGAECCSGSCDGTQCIPAGCLPQGEPCEGPVGNCCSGICDSGFCQASIDCSTFGVPCTQAEDCCSGNCVDEGGGDCAGGTCACAPSTGCLAAGDPCTADNQCCNELCDRPGGALEGACATLGSCRSAGEPCGTEGYNGSCCSTICLDTTGDGVPRCQFLGGCRVQDDLCSYDAECCSGSCEADGQTLDGRPILRCANADSCLPPGEICGGAGSSANCCPNGGGDTGCEPTGAGFRRCFGGTSGCVVPAQGCTETADCCAESFPAIQCQDTVDRGRICCLSDGELCAFGDLCCGGICSPSDDAQDPPGTLRCGTTCIADGGGCTVDADCCNCCRDGLCTAECDACIGPDLGEPCDPQGEACCPAPTAVCGGGEFPRCMLP